MQQQLGRYTIEERIGAGGFGEVWRGHLEGELGFRKPVAIKLLPVEAGSDAVANEALLGARLHHPNIVEVYEFTRIDDRWMLVMELVGGSTLEALCARHPDGLPPEAAVPIVRQLAAGLAYAHELRDEHGEPLGLVHRDLKPANAMVTPDGQVKILDFGIAVFRDAVRSTRPGRVRGTPHYLAPEQLEGASVHPSVDIWALGAIARQLATGAPLIPDGPTMRVLAAVASVDVAEQRRLVEAKVPALAGVVEACLQRDPAARPTARQVVDWLGGTPPSIEAPVEPRRSRRPWLPLAVLGAVVAVGGLWWAMPGTSGPPRGGTLEVAAPRARGTFDAYGRARTLSTLILPLVVEPPTRMEASGEVRPWLVTELEPDAGGQNWRLRVREDVPWHPHPCLPEPRDLDVEDLRFSIRSAVDEGFSGFELADPGLRVEGDRLVVSLTEPLPFLPQLLSSVPVLPRELQGCQSVRDLEWPVGTGPFRFDSAPMGEVLPLVRHERYWRADVPYVSGLVLRTVGDDRESLDLLSAGEVHLAELGDLDLLAEEGRALREDVALDGVRVADATGGSRLAIKGLLFFERSPNPLSDPEARRALSDAIGREPVSRVRPSDRFLLPQHLGYDPSLRAPPAPDGALEGLGTLRLGAFASDQPWARGIADQLETVGVDVEVVTLALTTLQEATTPGNPSPVDLALVELHSDAWGSVDPWPWVVDFSIALDEVSFVSDAQRAAAHRARTEPNRQARGRAYAAFERVLLEEMPFVPLGHLKGTSTGQTFLVREEVGGYVDPATGRLLGDDPHLGLVEAWLRPVSR